MHQPPAHTTPIPRPSAEERLALREGAEARFAALPASATAEQLAQMAPAMQHLLHELQVHQIELEMQNDELRRAQAALDTERAHYFDFYDLAPVGYGTLDARGLIIQANLTLARLTGLTRDRLIGQPIHAFIHKEDQDIFHLFRQKLLQTGESLSCELRLKRNDGSLFWVNLAALAMPADDGRTALRLVLSDISERKLQQAQLEHMAYYDVLTGLPNRVLKADRLQQAMALARRSGQRLAVVYIDLDGFKAINDQHGRATGDQMLIAVAKHMQAAMREGDTLARVGGDEFAAVLLDLANTEACVPLLERLLDAVAQPLQVGEQTLQVSASLGVTFYPQAQEIEADQLLRQSDQAMYQAKLAGKNRYQVFDAEQDSILRSWHEDLGRIRQALLNREFVLYYQPKVNMRTGQVVGAEALIRWQHPERGLLAPAAFLPLIDDHPLATEVGEWVMDTALTQMAVWQAQGLTLPVSVNVGALQLQQADFLARLKALLMRHPEVNPAHLELEILETSALQDTVYVSRLIEDCRQIGVSFALDDFGTGYSSLVYLKRLHVALIKMDQSFVRDMLHDPDDQAILQGIVGLASAFHCTVIAEGVETVAHGTRLLELGCELAQGFGIARPMPAADFPAWAASWLPDAAWRGTLPLS